MKNNNDKSVILYNLYLLLLESLNESMPIYVIYNNSVYSTSDLPIEAVNAKEKIKAIKNNFVVNTIEINKLNKTIDTYFDSFKLVSNKTFYNNIVFNELIENYSIYSEDFILRLYYFLESAYNYFEKPVVYLRNINFTIKDLPDSTCVSPVEVFSKSVKSKFQSATYNRLVALEKELNRMDDSTPIFRKVDWLYKYLNVYSKEFYIQPSIIAQKLKYTDYMSIRKNFLYVDSNNPLTYGKFILDQALNYFEENGTLPENKLRYLCDNYEKTFNENRIKVMKVIA